jgi:hypothetical protein
VGYNFCDACGWFRMLQATQQRRKVGFCCFLEGVFGFFKNHTSCMGFGSGCQTILNAGRLPPLSSWKDLSTPQTPPTCRKQA